MGECNGWSATLPHAACSPVSRRPEHGVWEESPVIRPEPILLGERIGDFRHRKEVHSSHGEVTPMPVQLQFDRNLMEGMIRNPQDEQTFPAMRIAFRAVRSALLIMIFTVGAIYFNRRGFYPPHGSPLIYAIAMSWLIALTIALPMSAIFSANSKLFSPSRWEKHGEVYDRTSIRAFRWVILHSPLGWINPNLHLGASRTDCERLLREMNVSEGVHWLTCFLASILAISYLIGGYAVHGYVMLLIRVPFDLYPIMLHRRNRGRVCRVLNGQLRTSR